MNMLPVEARALYLGGDRIFVDDPRISHSSSKELGLRCTVCGEPVQYNNGNVNAAHFSHFPTLNIEKREDCDRRRTCISGGSTNSVYPDVRPGQRLKLFQEYFFDIISNAVPELPSYKQIQCIHKAQACSPVLRTTLAYLRKEQEYFIRYIRTCDFPRVGILQVDIACEAFDYLIVKSSEIIAFSILECITSQLRESRSHNSKRENLEEVGITISNILLGIKWPKVFLEREREISIADRCKIEHTVRALGYNQDKDSIKLFQAVEGSPNLLVYLRKGKVFVGAVKDSLVVSSETLLGSLSIKELLNRSSSRRSRQNSFFSFKTHIEQVYGRLQTLEDKLLVYNHFRVALAEAIQNFYVDSGRTDVRVEGFGKVAHLDKPVDELLIEGKAKIICGKSVVAELTIETLLSYKGNTISLEDCFECSNNYSTIVKDNSKIFFALISLIRKKADKVSNKLNL